MNKGKGVECDSHEHLLSDVFEDIIDFLFLQKFKQLFLNLSGIGHRETVTPNNKELISPRALTNIFKVNTPG